MDGAQACYPYLAVRVEVTRGRVGRRGGPSDEALAVMLGGTASSADLAGYE